MSVPFDFYARIKAALFPLAPGSKNPVEPYAIVENWKTHCSRDPEQWAKWQAANPGCNFGVVAFASGLVIVDIDVAKHGRDVAWVTWRALCREWGVPLLMPQVQSARGGWHVYLRIPEGVNVRDLRQPSLMKGVIDVRVTGFTVAAGSYFGELPYVLISDHEPEPVPEALLEILKRKLRPLAAVVSKKSGYRADQVGELLSEMFAHGLFDDYHDWIFALAALRAEFGDVEGIPLGHRITWAADVESGEFDTKWQSFSTELKAGDRTMNSIFQQASSLNLIHVEINRYSSTD